MRNSIEEEMSCRVCSGYCVLQLEMSGRTGRACTKGDMTINVESISRSTHTDNSPSVLRTSCSHLPPDGPAHLPCPCIMMHDSSGSPQQQTWITQWAEESIAPPTTGTLYHVHSCQLGRVNVGIMKQQVVVASSWMLKGALY